MVQKSGSPVGPVGTWNPMIFPGLQKHPRPVGWPWDLCTINSIMDHQSNNPRRGPHVFHVGTVGKWGKVLPFCAKLSSFNVLHRKVVESVGFQTVCFAKVCFAKLDPTSKCLPKSWWFVRTKYELSVHLVSRSIAVFMFPSGIFPKDYMNQKQKDRNKNKAKNKDTLNQHCNDKTPTKTQKKTIRETGRGSWRGAGLGCGQSAPRKGKGNKSSKKNQKESNNQNTKNQTNKTQNNQRDETRKGELRRDNRGGNPVKEREGRGLSCCCDFCGCFFDQFTGPLSVWE